MTGKPDEQRTVKVSKYLSKHLRHRPERIGVTLDAYGWVAVADLALPPSPGRASANGVWLTDAVPQRYLRFPTA